MLRVHKTPKVLAQVRMVLLLVSRCIGRFQCVVSCIPVVTAKMGPETFVAKGLVVLERNYLNVMKYERWDGHLLPDFTVGQVFQPSSLLLRESVTHPPPLLSEADLIAVMDENGIGTDATIAEHISKIQTRQYTISLFPCG